MHGAPPPKHVHGGQGAVDGISHRDVEDRDVDNHQIGDLLRCFSEVQFP